MIRSRVEATAFGMLTMKHDRSLTSSAPSSADHNGLHSLLAAAGKVRSLAWGDGVNKIVGAQRRHSQAAAHSDAPTHSFTLVQILCINSRTLRNQPRELLPKVVDLMRA